MAREDRAVVEKYVEEELALGRYDGPFTRLELEEQLGYFQSSPFGVVPKPNSNKKRIVQNLSFPETSSPVPSINSRIDSDDFPCGWDGPRQAADLLLSLPRTCTAASYDVRAAYRVVPVHPEDKRFFIVMWELDDGQQVFFVDQGACFGCASSAGVWGSVGDCFVALLGEVGAPHVLRWVDDFFLLRILPHLALDLVFKELASQLGLPLADEKERTFASVGVYHGLEWDCTIPAVAISQDKLTKTLAHLSDFLSPSSSRYRHDFEKLLGRLTNLAFVLQQGRPYLVALAHQLSRIRNPFAPQPLDTAVGKDLAWWSDALVQARPRRLLSPSLPIDLDWSGDASTEYGIGVVIGPYCASWKWRGGWEVARRVGADFARSIQWGEALAVLAGGALLDELVRREALGRVEGAVLVLIDNEAVRLGWEKRKSREKGANEVFKRLQEWEWEHDILLVMDRVSSELNRADGLSRGDFAEASRADLHFVDFTLPPSLAIYLT